MNKIKQGMIPGIVVADDRPDFSGSYRLTKSTLVPDYPAKGNKRTLEVVQAAASMLVTIVRTSGSVANKFSLDGTPGAYIDPSGVGGKCKGHFKGRVLYLDAFIATRVNGGGPKIEVHTTERWELSSDAKTLTINIENHTTNAETGQEILNNVSHFVEIYSRN